MKPVFLELSAFIDKDDVSEFVDRMMQRFGREDALQAASDVLRGVPYGDAFPTLKHRAGRMFLKDSDYSTQVRQWVMEEAELREFFEVRDDDVYFRTDIPVAEREELSEFVRLEGIPHVHVRLNPDYQRETVQRPLALVTPEAIATALDGATDDSTSVATLIRAKKVLLWVDSDADFRETCSVFGLRLTTGSFWDGRAYIHVREDDPSLFEDVIFHGKYTLFYENIHKIPPRRLTVAPKIRDAASVGWSVNDPKRVLIDLVTFLEGHVVPEVAQRAVAQFGRDDVRAAAARLISCLAWKPNSRLPRFGRMFLGDGEFDDTVRQWVNAEPKLRALFEVRDNDVCLRKDLPDTEQVEIANFAVRDIRRHRNNDRRLVDERPEVPRYALRETQLYDPATPNRDQNDTPRNADADRVRIQMRFVTAGRVVEALEGVTEASTSIATLIRTEKLMLWVEWEWNDDFTETCSVLGLDPLTTRSIWDGRAYIHVREESPWILDDVVDTGKHYLLSEKEFVIPPRRLTGVRRFRDAVSIG